MTSPRRDPYAGQPRRHARSDMPRAGTSPYRRPTGYAPVRSGPPASPPSRRPMMPGYEDDPLDQDGYDGWGTPPPHRPPPGYPPSDYAPPDYAPPRHPPTAGRPDILDLEPAVAPPDPKPRGRYSGKRRRENPWISYGLIIAVPLVLVLLIVAFSALPPYTPSTAQSQPQPTVPVNPSPRPSGAASPPRAPGATVASYEAENSVDNKLGPTTKVRAVPDASGGQVVTNVGHGTPAGDVKFTNVTAPKAGSYTVTAYYATTNTQSHRIALFVNDGDPKIYTYPGLPDPDQIGAFKMTVKLAAGTNVLRFSNATKNYGPDLDRITVQPA